MEAYTVYSFYLPYFTQHNFFFFEMQALCCIYDQFLPFLFPEQYSTDCIATLWVVSLFTC